MPKYAAFNSAISGPTFSGWYDTDLFTYASLPPPADMLELTTAEWDAHFANPNGWAVQSGALVTYTPPAPPLTLAQQAAALLATGIAITSMATAALDATYSASATAQAQINAEVTSILLNGTFADGTSTIDWLDVSGVSHTFTIAQFKLLATKIAIFVSGCVKCVNGQTTVLPNTSATIL